MLVHNSIEFFNEVYAAHKETFDQSFHNFLWQLVINKAKDEKLICFTPVYRNGNLEIGMAEFGATGYYPSYVSFVSKDYDKACEVCDDINLKLFGMAPELTMIIIAKSMAKEEPHPSSAGVEDDED